MKKLVLAAFLMIFSALCLTGCAEEETNGVLQPRYYEEEEGKTYTVENDSLKLELDGDTTSFKLTNKVTNKIWYSNPVDNGSTAKGKGQDVLSSTMLVQYSNKTDNKVDIDNYSQSIKNKNYTIEQIDSTTLKVNYSVGEVEKIFICPTAATQTRMNEFLSKMDESTQKRVTRQYSVYDYTKLDGEDLDNALMMFPDLEKDPVYVLRDGISDYYAQMVQDQFMAVGYTEADYRKDKETFNIVSNKEKPVFNVSVYYILDGNEFVVKTPMEEIEYNKTYPIVELTILPYMGAGSETDKGYVLVPAGTGGIINFNNGKTGQQAYISDMYGWDYGVYRDMVVDETKSNFPLFAISRNDEAFLCTSEEGSSYATVRADISGKENGYNYGRFSYRMLHGENMDISNKSDTTVRVFEKSLPKENLTQRYIFSAKTDYVGLATKYREYLMKKYPTLQKKDDKNVSMAVEVLGAVDSVEHILGYPVVRSQALTTYSEAKALLQDFVKEGVSASDLSVKYSGWYNTGMKSNSSAQVNLVGRLGGASDIEDLSAYAKEQGIDLFMEGYFSYVYKDNMFDGFTQNRDAAKYCSREIAELYPIWPVSYQPWTDEPYYLTKPSYSKKCLEHFVEQISDLGTANVAFKDYGSKLGADYNPKDRTSREKAMNMEAESMSKLKESGSKLMTQVGYQYTVPYSDVITDFPITSSQINLIDETVPFYTIALHGLVDYTGNAVNLAEDYERNFLKSVENGAGLYYVFMDADSSELQEGLYTQYYACNYSDWKGDALAMYKRFSKELGDTYNQFIVKHEQIASGVYLTGYENGKEVIVNYNYNDYNFNGLVVPKRNFVVKGGGQ